MTISQENLNAIRSMLQTANERLPSAERLANSSDPDDADRLRIALRDVITPLNIALQCAGDHGVVDVDDILSACGIEQ